MAARTADTYRSARRNEGKTAKSAKAKGKASKPKMMMGDGEMPMKAPKGKC